MRPSWKRTAFLTISGLVLTSSAFFYWFGLDEPLDPIAQQLINQATPTTQTSNAYLYLLGINAAADEDPLTVGKQIFASIQQGEKLYFQGKQAFTYQAYPANKALPLPNGDLFCSIAKQANCLASLFAADVNTIKATLTQHATLLQRYKFFIKQDDYQTLSQPQSNEPSNNLVYLTKAESLLILESILYSKQGETIKALALLKSSLDLNRQRLKQSDNLIQKIIYKTYISNLIDSIYLTLKIDNKLNFIIEPLTVEELSLEKPIAREFAFLATSIKYITSEMKLQALDNKDTNQYRVISGMYLLYKSNITINANILFYQPIQQIHKVKPENLASYKASQNRAAYKALNKIKVQNLVGTILNKLEKPDFYSYAERLFDTNAKIQLFNQLQNPTTDLNTIISQPANFYNKIDKWQLSDDKKRICLRSPIQNKIDVNCLPLTFD